MKKPKSIQFILSTGLYGIPSVNSLYRARVVYTSRMPVAQIYKSGDAKKVIQGFDDQLKMIDFNNRAPWIWDKDATFDLQIQLLFKQSFFRRDTDNTIKLIQDSIARHLGVNDSRIITVHATKSICPNLQEEKVCVCLSQSTEEIRFDKLEDLPIPDKIFLGGTCANSNWREEIIPELEKRKLDYFNPVVPDWTEECIKKENDEKENICDCHLYVLTPEMKGMYSIAEIVNSAYEVKLSGYGSMICGILGDEESWGTDRWKSLKATLDLINNIMPGSKKVVAKFISAPLEILDNLGNASRKRKRSNP